MFEENENFYPAKPELIQPEQRSRYVRMLFSILLFFVVFVTLISENNYLLAAEIIGILILHESGHLLTMKIFGYKALNMVFIPFLGAMVSGKKLKVSQRQRFWISLMGPFPGIVLGCSLLAYGAMVAPDYYLVELALLLISINLFNLIPLDPLDGGNIIEILFFPSNENAKMYYTLISSILIILVGVYTSFFPLLIFGFLMAFKVRAYQKNKVIHDDLEELDLNYKKEYNELSDREYWTIRKVFLDKNPKIKELIPEDGTIWENEKLIVEQVNQLLRFEVIKDLSHLKRFLLFILFLASIVVPLFIMAKNYELIEWYMNHEAL